MKCEIMSCYNISLIYYIECNNCHNSYCYPHYKDHIKKCC